MSTDRETSHDMSDSDIAVLLADATDEVEIGIAPYQAVLRGGRRRRARRWAVAAATALVLAGSSATLAVAGLPGGGDGRGAVATQPPVTGTPNVFEPANRTTLATGTENGKEWRVTVDTWQAPVDTAEAEATMHAMQAYGEYPPDVRGASDLVGKIAYFVHRDYGGESTKVMENTVPKTDRLTGTDLMSGSLPSNPAARRTSASSSATSPRPPSASTAPGRTGRRRWWRRPAPRPAPTSRRSGRRRAPTTTGSCAWHRRAPSTRRRR